jgi:hypothetical protein
MNEIEVSILEYLGTLENGVLVILSIMYSGQYFEGTFFYTAEDILLTISKPLEKELGHKIEDDPEYVDVLKDILKKITPYNEVMPQLKAI